MTLLPDEKNKTEKLKESGRKWRNRWRALCAGWQGNIQRQTGEVYDCFSVWPSRDIAETKAAAELVHLRACQGFESGEHLGAFETE